MFINSRPVAQAQRCRHGISPHTLSLFLEPLEQLPQLLDLGGHAALGGAARGRVLLHAAHHAEHLRHIAAKQGARGTGGAVRGLWAAAEGFWGTLGSRNNRDTNLMFCRSSRLRWLMVMPLVSASWTALPEATWACLKGICSAKGTEQRGLSSVPPLHPKNSHLQVSLWHLLPSEPGTEPGQWPTSPGSAPSPCSPC